MRLRINSPGRARVKRIEGELYINVADLALALEADAYSRGAGPVSDAYLAKARMLIKIARTYQDD